MTEIEKRELWKLTVFWKELGQKLRKQPHKHVQGIAQGLDQAAGSLEYFLKRTQS